MSEMKAKRATIVVDLHHSRCDLCKVALRDDLATECAVCGAHFELIVSNHVGLAGKLSRKRESAGVRNGEPG